MFGLGASGLASASALLAGGAEVVVLGRQPSSARQGAAAGIPVADLRDVDWSRIAALVLAPGVPLTHPEPHWTVGARAQARASRSSATSSCSAASGGKSAPRRAVRRHHRHQRQIDHDGADRRICVDDAGLDAQMGGNIGTAMLSLEPFAPGRVHVIEVLVLSDRSRAQPRAVVGILLNVTEDHLDRHGTLRELRGHQGAAPGNGSRADRDRRRRRQLGQEAAERIARAGRRVVRVSVRRPLRDGYYVEGIASCSARAARPSRR